MSSILLTAPALEPITLDEAKAFVRVEVTDDDDVIMALIAGARIHVEARTRRAEIWLQDLWAGRESADFALAPSYLALSAGDVIGLTVNGRRRLMELQELTYTESRRSRRSRSIRRFSTCRSLPRN
jgi:uncharacterized phiE125 gp8 family phage protein